MSDISKLPLKALRARANLTQQQVAEKIGINRMTYSQWENYQTFPDALQLIKLSQIFACSMDTFYFPLAAS